MSPEAKDDGLYPSGNFSRRDFFDRSFWLLSIAGITPKYIDYLYQKFVKPGIERTNPAVITAAHSFWEPRYTREWGPIFKGGVEQLQNQDPNRGLSLFDQVAQAKGMPVKALETALYVINYAIEEGNRQLNAGEISQGVRDSYGFCWEAAAFRARWISPGLGSRVYQANGSSFVLDEGTMAVWVMAAGTNIAKIKDTKVAYDANGNKLSDAIYHRLYEWFLNPNRRPFVLDRPKPGQEGQWFVTCLGVTEDLQFVLTDDFNNGPNYFPVSLVNAYMEPQPLAAGLPIPPEHQEGVNQWLAKWDGGRIPADLHLVYDGLYNSQRI
ncbi:MAG: hypothetical protein HYW45_02635 [Candidatus Daviesbacteria bacterium]|nr:MAG: hypothetical protein HYW45_02635 [Candidatus Daviesbacteria bacterium]